MDECCDICGDKGVREAMATCCRCKVSREHVYCMRIALLKPTPDWCCEFCEQGNITIQTSVVMEGLPKASSSDPLAKRDLPPPNKNLDQRQKNSMEREKKIPTGKVKHLSPEEVIMLSSGSNNPAPAVKFSFRQYTGMKKSKASDVEKTSFKPKTIPPNLSSSRLVKANPSFGLSKQPNPSRASTSHINAAPQAKQPRANAHQSPTEELALAEYFQQKQRNDAENIVSIKLEKDTLKAPPGYASAEDRHPVCTSGGVSSLSPKLHRDHPLGITDGIPSSDVECSYGPTPHHSWKGSFRGFGDFKFQEDKDDIQAHHPSRVRRKVYEFSKQMPDVLNFELVHRKDLWVKLFQDYSPDQKDIGLYFFPSNEKRSDKYVSLMNIMQMEDLGLRMAMDGAELLVFTSQLLCSDCQKWEGRHFLWGLFYREQQKKAAGPSDLKELHRQDDDQVEVDMEIDMVGGREVGITDMFLPRKRMLLPSPETKSVTHGEVPPGFERKHKLRL